MNYGLTKTRVRLAGGAAILALSAGAAMAQEGVEQVVVSSTRLQSAGFDAPTPTTVVSAADLEAQAKPNVFDAITQMPALQGSTGVGYNTGSTTTGLIGLSALGLRGLSPLRTLVLIDGQRVVGGNFNGAVDVSQMPQMLIKRVDVVTGGASASWGSDAVAGVINFVTDTRFEGFKANLQAGLSTYGDMGTVTAQAAAGTSFAGGRGHFEVAAEYSYNDGLLPRYPTTSQFGAQPNIGGRTIARQSGTSSYSSDSATPAGQPRTYYGPLIQNTGNAANGLITNGPLIGTTFSNGQPVAWDYAGNCYTDASNTLKGNIGNNCFGTPSDPGNQNDSHHFTQGLYDPLTRGDVYARVSYDLTPTTQIFASLNYGISRTQNTPAQGNSSKSGTLRCDNAYLLQMGLFADTAACLAAYPGNAINYGSDWVNIPYRPADVPAAHHAPRRCRGQRHLRLPQQDLVLGFLLPARRDRHQRQDLQHAPVQCAGRSGHRQGECGGLALQPVAGRGVQFEGADRLPQHHCPGLWLRAMEPLWRHPVRRPGRLL